MRTVSRWAKVLACAGLLIGLGATQARAGILFDQPRLGTDEFMPGLNSNAGDQVIYDDFTLAGASAITGVRWSGVYQQTTVLTTDPVNFFVGIYSDQAGLPGSLLMGQTVAVAGTQIGISPNLKYPVFSYDIALATPLSVAAGSKLWLSVVESDPTTRVTWSWEFHDYLKGNKVAYQSGPGGPLQLSFNDYDVAFTVMGSPVPEPSTFVLASVAGLTLLAGRFLRPARTKRS